VILILKQTNMVKIQKISNTSTPFGGIFLVNEMFKQCGLSELIDRELGKRNSNLGYTYSNLIRNFFNLILSGGECVEDIHQHFLYHLAPNGQAGFVLAKGSLTSKTSGEGDIRKALIENKLIDCIVNLPAKLFLNTQIPASLWFMSRNRTNGKYRDRSDEILFIDARNLGHLINRRTRELSDEDIQKIAETYHNWRTDSEAGRGGIFPSSGGVSEGLGIYEDIPGFCASVPISKVAELDYVLTPGRYVGLPEEDDDFNFEERFTALKAEFEEQLKEEASLNKAILENLSKIKY
jgi:type I restriction enzyme M protein